MEKTLIKGASSDASFIRSSQTLTGKLFYIVGPSGVGKDSLIETVRHQYVDQFMVAHRYITRCAEAGGENHVALSEAEFALRRNSQLFAMHWVAHGNHYGVGSEVLSWLEQGHNVILNGSRAQLEQAKAVFGQALVTVVVTVAPNVLRQRLEQRGRETDEEVERRLLRSEQFCLGDVEGVFELDNSHSLEQAAEQFWQIHRTAVLGADHCVTQSDGSVGKEYTA